MFLTRLLIEVYSSLWHLLYGQVSNDDDLMFDCAVLDKYLQRNH